MGWHRTLALAIDRRIVGGTRSDGGAYKPRIRPSRATWKPARRMAC